MQAAIVPASGAAYELVELATPEPGPGQVRVKVHACGYCHSDENIRRGWTGNAFPRVPGHEVAGTIDSLDADVPADWREGDRVGVGWHGGHCLSCDACRDGRFLQCPRRLGCGTSYDGGFAEFVVAPWTALVRIPAAVSFADAGPVMCAGITVWNAIRNSGAQWGALVAVQGIGGLGHLAVQYADKMGFETVAISRGPEKETLARELGADHFLEADAAVAGLQELGGARAIICTAPSGQAMRDLYSGLGRDGRLMVVGVSAEPISLPAHKFLSNQRGVAGSVIGTPAEAEALLRFGAVKGIRPRIERFRLEQVHEAQERLLENRLRFRAVFEMHQAGRPRSD